MRSVLLAVLLVGSAAASDVPTDSPLKAICKFMCGSWVPEEIDDEHNSDAFALELHWDPASGELRGTQTVSGGPNGTVMHELAFRADPQTKQVVLITRSVDPAMWTQSAVELEETSLRIFSVTPGNPAISALVQWAFVETDRMVATRAESAAGYNYFFGDQYYRKVK